MAARVSAGDTGRGVKAPRILLLGGYEPTGRMGLLADIATVRSLGGSAQAVPTALTAQGRGTFGIETVSAPFVRRQLDAIEEHGPVHAVKTGMIPDGRLLRTISRRIPEKLPWVLDPVIRSSTGRVLSNLRARELLALARPGITLTPNADEAAWLLGLSAIESIDQAIDAARALHRLGFGAVVLKGGHFRGGAGEGSKRGAAKGLIRAAQVFDVVCAGAAGRVTVLCSQRLPRLPGGHRGTGCRHASALAVSIARRSPVLKAAENAKVLIHQYLKTPII